MRDVQSLTRLFPDECWKILNIFGHFLGASWLLLVMTPKAFMMWAVLASALLGGALSSALKSIFSASRPAAVMPEQLHIIGETLLHASMPSGHAMTIAIAGGLFLSLYPKLSPFGKRLAFPLGALAVGVCLARVASGAHWPADVCIGAGLGLVVGFQTGRWIRRWMHRLPQAALLNPTGRALIAISLIVIPLPPSCSAEASVALGLSLALWQLHQWHSTKRSWLPNPKSSKF